MRPEPAANTQLERELNYYRRECNDLGARLLRLQEEQSRTFREARRSRTVVKLLREAYRLGDVTAAGVDVGGPMLEIVVENALCDRAALLREEPLGSGRFLIPHAIGLTGGSADAAVTVTAPPTFLYTNSREKNLDPAAELIEVLGVPFVLWAYDQASGHALLIGNRSQSNVSQPFEAGDQEFIESALSVYLDVLYRKQAEARLRQSKQAAEASGLARRQFLEMLTEELSMPLKSISALAGKSSDGQGASEAARADAEEIGRISAYVLSLLGEAATLLHDEREAPSLDMEWMAVEEVVRAALRSVYARSVRQGVELVARMPRRRIAVCVDRVWMQHVLQHLISSAMRLTSEGGAVRIEAGRRSEGSTEVLVSSGEERLAVAGEPAVLDPYESGDAWAAGGDLAITRRLVEAHGGTLTIERNAVAAVRARLILPPELTRDETMDAA